MRWGARAAGHAYRSPQVAATPRTPSDLIFAMKHVLCTPRSTSQPASDGGVGRTQEPMTPDGRDAPASASFEPRSTPVKADLASGTSRRSTRTSTLSTAPTSAQNVVPCSSTVRPCARTPRYRTGPLDDRARIVIQLGPRDARILSVRLLRGVDRPADLVEGVRRSVVVVATFVPVVAAGRWL